MKLLRTLLWAMVLIPTLLSAQPTQQEARRMAYAEAERQGVDPAELETRLQARGINTATLTMSDIPRVQPVIEEEIAKMKAEQTAEADSSSVKIVKAKTPKYGLDSAQTINQRLQSKVFAEQSTKEVDSSDNCKKCGDRMRPLRNM